VFHLYFTTHVDEGLLWLWEQFQSFAFNVAGKRHVTSKLWWLDTLLLRSNKYL
jgi:hypothetical protein